MNVHLIGSTLAALAFIAAATPRWPIPPAWPRCRSAPRPPTSACPGSTARPTASGTSPTPRSWSSSSPATTARPPRRTRTGSPKLHADYKDKGVAVVAISPNDPAAVRLDELGYTDLGDSFEEMKIRARDHRFAYPVPLRRRDAGDGARPTACWPRRTSTSSTPIASSATSAGSTTREVKAVKSHDAMQRRRGPAGGQAGARRQDAGLRLLDQVGRQAGRRRASRWRSGTPSRSRSRRSTPTGVAKLARNETKNAAAGQPLGDLVRPLRGRAARARHDQPDVPRPAVPAGHDQPRRARRRRTRPSGCSRRITSRRPTTSMSAPGPRQASPRPSTRNGPARCPTRCSIAPGGKVVYRKAGAIDPLELKRAIVGHLGRTH